MPERVMVIQLKTGYDTDSGPSWISRIQFTRSWRSAYFRGRLLHRVTGRAHANYDSNFYDVDSGERYWLSGPKRDRSDGRYRHVQPTIDEDVRVDYEAFLAGAPLPGREQG